MIRWFFIISGIGLINPVQACACGGGEAIVVIGGIFFVGAIFLIFYSIVKGVKVLSKKSSNKIK